jgi:hypothetical protein
MNKLVKDNWEDESDEEEEVIEQLPIIIAEKCCCFVCREDTNEIDQYIVNTGYFPNCESKSLNKEKMDEDGVKGAEPLGVKGAEPLGVKGAEPLGVKGAEPLGVKGAEPLGVKRVLPLEYEENVYDEDEDYEDGADPLEDGDEYDDYSDGMDKKMGNYVKCR